MAGVPVGTPVVAGDLVANVVDIRRFSTHDGDGIRTTIFLKGCSLACSWCQNPETINPNIRPVFFRNRCIDCGLCLEHARNGAAVRDAEGTVWVDTTVEDDWDALVACCPTGAIGHDSTRYTVSQLVEIAQRDRVFFGSQGGVTLSGGEPLLLPGFAPALLRALKEAGIDTAVETALNVRREHVFDALAWCDHMFADCKLIDSAAHRRHAGHGNERILGNLEALLRSDRRDDVTVRTPLIPGITDGADNIAGIARFISGIYPGVRYELLNYNPLAAAKYDNLPGRSFVFSAGENPPMFTKAQLAEFHDLARASGIRNLVTH